MDRLTDLALYVAVVDTGSMSAAARRLETTPAQVSKRLQLLEASLGARLLHRTTRRLTPTTEGERFLERCRNILEEVREAEAEIRAEQSQPAGIIKLTASASFGRRHIAPALPQFLARYPAVQIHLLLTDAVVDLVEEGLDLAIRIGAAPDSRLVAFPLAVNRRVLCASPAYLAAHGRPQTPEDLAGHNCLLLDRPGIREQSWRLQGPTQLHRVKVRGNLVVNNGEVIGAAAEAGLGIAIKSTWDIGEALGAGRLERVLPDYRLPEADLVALTPHRRHLQRKVRLLIDHLKQHFGPEPYWDRETTTGEGRSPAAPQPAAEDGARENGGQRAD